MDTQLLDLGLAVPQATAPAEYRGLTRDSVKLLILDHFARTAENASAHDLPQFLEPGDMIVVNDSAMIGARLQASCSAGEFVLHMAADLGPGLALVERRGPREEPDWTPFAAGEQVVLTDGEGRELSRGTVAGRFHPQSRLWLVNTQDPWYQVAAVSGSPVRYGYVGHPYPLSDYQSVFGCRPGSSEMPSASRPFSLSLVAALRRRGVEFGSLTLHTSLSSHEVATSWQEHPVIPEWFQVPELTARRANATRRAGHSLIALGTTVARALETCYDASRGAVAPRSGWTRHLITPEDPPQAVTGLITGLHDNFTSHLALVYAFTGPDFLKAAYRDAASWGYLWHEFGDLCLIHSRYNNREEALQAR